MYVFRVVQRSYSRRRSKVDKYDLLDMLMMLRNLFGMSWVGVKEIETRVK
jgi:hypothetical protein